MIRVDGLTLRVTSTYAQYFSMADIGNSVEKFHRQDGHVEPVGGEMRAASHAKVLGCNTLILYRI